jgi:hypothetical protein
MPKVLPMEKEPGKEHPIAARRDPLVVEAPGDERRHGKSEGHRATDEPRVEARRMDDHVDVL